MFQHEHSGGNKNIDVAIAAICLDAFFQVRKRSALLQ
jgi:hypothetical protein